MKNTVQTDSVEFASFENIRRLRDIASVTPIALDFCGSENCAPLYSYGPATRPVYILHVIASGRGKLVKNGRKYSLEAGQAFLIYPGEENYYQADEADPWTYLWIGFHGFQAEEMMHRSGFTREKPVIHCSEADAICRRMEAMLKNSALTYTGEMIRLSELYGILSLLADAGSEEVEAEDESISLKSDINHEYVQAAVSLLTSSYGTQIRVAEVAETIGISRNYLDTIFKREMGVSPKEFLMSFRMEKATALLAQTDNPVGVIAGEVGYADPMTFSKIFRIRFGMSPTEFREARKGERRNVQNSI